MRSAFLLLLFAVACAESHSADAGLADVLDGGAVADVGAPSDGPSDAGPTDAPGADAGVEARDAALCGDGIVDPGEECDDGDEWPGDGCDACRFSACSSSFGGMVAAGACPADRPWCSVLRADGSLGCTADVGSLEPGAPCTADADCRSGYCSADQGRCSTGCQPLDTCGVGLWCVSGLDVGRMASLETSCAWACGRSADCGAGRVCRLRDAIRSFGGFEATVCVDASWEGEVPSDVPLGERCSGADECVEGACDSAVGCAELCITDEDCDDPARPWCRELLSWHGVVESPPGAPWAHPHVCASRCGDGSVDPGEDCDDGNLESGDECDSLCQWRRCSTSAECPAAAPFCSQPDGMWARCRPGNPGAADVGASCGSDGDCASGYCSPTEGICTEYCGTFGTCPAGSRCAAWCSFPCASDAECSGGRVCGMEGTRTHCALPGAGAAFGDPCDRYQYGADCSTRACAQVVDDGTVACTRICTSDMDCAAPFPRCVPLTDSVWTPLDPVSVCVP